MIRLPKIKFQFERYVTRDTKKMATKKSMRTIFDDWVHNANTKIKHGTLFHVRSVCIFDNTNTLPNCLPILHGCVCLFFFYSVFASYSVGIVIIIVVVVDVQFMCHVLITRAPTSSNKHSLQNQSTKRKQQQWMPHKTYFSHAYAMRKMDFRSNIIHALANQICLSRTSSQSYLSIRSYRTYEQTTTGKK